MAQASLAQPAPAQFPSTQPPYDPSTDVLDLIIVGGGPCGLACAVAARRRGLSHLILEKGAFLNTLVRFPQTMTFFSAAELLEIGDIPFALPHLRPTRAEGIAYFQKVAQREQVQMRTYEPVTHIAGQFGDFTVTTVDRTGATRQYRSRAVVIATGYYDNPRRLGVPGEELDHVRHHYDQPQPYFQQRVVVIGGRNSAVQVALELYRHGAFVTLVHRGPGLSDRVKPWIRPDIDARLRKGEIPAYFNTRVERIERDRVHLVRDDGHRFTLPADFVLAMIGYEPDHSLKVQLGVHIDPETGAPVYDPETMETNVPGVYLAGVAAGGHEPNHLMIENGRFHGPKIVAHLAGLLGR